MRRGEAAAVSAAPGLSSIAGIGLRSRELQ